MKTLFLLLLSFPVFYFLNDQDKSDFYKEYSKTSGLKKLEINNWEDSSQRKENPVIPGDFADPSIIRTGNRYYATGTSSEWAPHFPLYQSTDLFHWQSIGYVFNHTPSWAASSFWAPELFYRNGTYFVYYVAKRKTDGISCIGVATAKDPAKGFTDKGIVLEYGKEAIDPFIIEENGQLYITWKAYGLDNRPIEILGSRLSDDGLKVEGKPFTLLRDDEKKGLEGQCLVKKDRYYYLFYSLGACCGRNCSYQVEVARSASLQGPYTKFANNPILAETEEWKCTGHGTVVTSGKGKYFYLYHDYSKVDNVYTGRQGMLGEVLWNPETGWPQLQPLGGGLAIKKNFRDDFSKARLSSAWQWDFRHTEVDWKVGKGNLYLSGQTYSNNQTGTAVTVRPLTGEYELSTTVINHNFSLKGLVLYGDADQSVGIGVKDDAIQLWEVKKGNRSVLKEEKVAGKEPLQFKMKVAKGYQCRFYWSESNGDWKEIKSEGDYYNADFLPPWDRSPRPGLMHQGSSTEPAVFSFFEIVYQ